MPKHPLKQPIKRLNQISEKNMSLDPEEILDAKIEIQLDELYVDAEIANRKLGRFINQVSRHFSKQVGGIKTAPLKDRDTAKAKLTRGGRQRGVEDLKDIARATLMFDSMDAMYAARDYIRQQPEYTQLADGAMKNRYAPEGRGGIGPTPQGYRDIKFFLLMNLGNNKKHIVELQLNTKRTLKAKSVGHPFYDIIRLGGDLWDPAQPNSDLLIPAKVVQKVGPKLLSACQQCIERQIEPEAARKVRKLVKDRFYKPVYSVPNSRGKRTIRRYVLKTGSVRLLFNTQQQIAQGQALIVCSSAAYAAYKKLGSKYMNTGRPDDIWNRR